MEFELVHPNKSASSQKLHIYISALFFPLHNCMLDLARKCEIYGLREQKLGEVMAEQDYLFVHWKLVREAEKKCCLLHLTYGKRIN